MTDGGSCAVGGDPLDIRSGSTTLGAASGTLQTAVAAIATICGDAEGAGGDASMSAALSGFQAAITRYTHDLSLQVEAASRLAASGAADLIAATGGGS